MHRLSTFPRRAAFARVCRGSASSCHFTRLHLGSLRATARGFAAAGCHPPACWFRFCWTSRDVTQGTALPYCSAIHRGGLLSSHKAHTAFTAHRQFENRIAGVPVGEKALIRHRLTDSPSAQPILKQPADNPSRSRDREAPAGDSVFPASGRGAGDLRCRRRRRAQTRRPLVGDRPDAKRLRTLLLSSRQCGERLRLLVLTERIGQLDVELARGTDNRMMPGRGLEDLRQFVPGRHRPGGSQCARDGFG